MKNFQNRTKIGRTRAEGGGGGAQEKLADYFSSKTGKINFWGPMFGVRVNPLRAHRHHAENPIDHIYGEYVKGGAEYIFESRVDLRCICRWQKAFHGIMHYASRILA